MPAGKQVFIEVKTGPEIVPALLEVLHDSGVPRTRVSVLGFDAQVVCALKAQDPASTWGPEGSGASGPAGSPAATGAGTVNWLTAFDPNALGKRPPPHDEQIMQALAACGADGLGCEALVGRVDRPLVEMLRKRGLGFHVWTVNDPQAGKYFMDLGADSLTTDHPGALREQLGLG